MSNKIETVELGKLLPDGGKLYTVPELPLVIADDKLAEPEAEMVLPVNGTLESWLAMALIESLPKPLTDALTAWLKTSALLDETEFTTGEPSLIIA